MSENVEWEWGVRQSKSAGWPAEPLSYIRTKTKEDAESAALVYLNQWKEDYEITLILEVVKRKIVKTVGSWEVEHG